MTEQRIAVKAGSFALCERCTHRRGKGGCIQRGLAACWWIVGKEVEKYECSNFRPSERYLKQAAASIGRGEG